MIEFLTITGALAAAVLSIAGVCGLCWAGVKRPWKKWRTQTAADRAKLDAICKALGPNGGQSLADAIGRQERALERQSLRIENNTLLLRETVAGVRAIGDFMERAIFQTCDEGEWTRVNVAFERSFGYGVRELLGMGWLNLIGPDQRDRIATAWRFAVKDKRAFRSAARVVTKSGAELDVLIDAQPQIEGGTLIGWWGAFELRKLEGTR